MPPTSRLTPATAPSSIVSNLVVPVIVWAISRVSSTLKSSFSPAVIRRRSRISSSIEALTRSVDAPSRAATVSWLTFWLPVTRRWSVRSGITTVSSWSRPIDAWPFEASSPMTSHVNCFTRMTLPTGLAAPNSLFRTVSPMTHTAAPDRSSASEKTRPDAIVQLAAVK